MKKIKFKLFYTALALMGLGVLMANCEKDKKGSLPEVTTAEITNIEDLTANGGGTVTNSGGSDIVALGLCWSSTSQEPTTSDNYASVGTYTTKGIIEDEWDFSVTMGASRPFLQTKTSYHVRAYAANEAGVAYGEVKQFTTLPGKIFHTLAPEMLSVYTNADPWFPASHLLDDDYETYWTSNYWDPNLMAPLPHYIQITFDEPKPLGGFQYWHRDHDDGDKPNSFDLQVSSDGESWSTVWESETDLPLDILPPTPNELKFDQNHTSSFFRIRILTTPNMGQWTYLSQIKVFEDEALDY